MNKREDKIYNEFTDYIQNKLDGNDFWEWVGSWLDPMAVIDIAKGWDISEMKGELAKWKKADKKSDKWLEKVDDITNEIMDYLRDKFNFKAISESDDDETDSDLDDEVYSEVHSIVKKYWKGGQQ